MKRKSTLNQRLILIIDDEVKMRKKYKKFLTRAGFKVTEAANAMEASEALMKGKSLLDLILLDIQMAEVDGRDVFDIIDEYCPNIPVIVSSVYPVSEQKSRIPRAADYFHKLSKEKTLLEKIRSVLGLENPKK